MAGTSLERGIVKNLAHKVAAKMTAGGKTTHTNIPCVQLIVPDGKQWDLYTVRAVFDPTGSGNAGARTLSLELQDESGNPVFESPAGASTTNAAIRDYSWITGVPRDTAFLGAAPQVTFAPLPHQTTLSAGMKINIYDDANVDGNDTVAVDILGEEVTIA